MSCDRTTTEIEEELAEWVAAQSSILKLGQSYTIHSGGSQRVVTQADLALVRQTIRDLRTELCNVNGDLGFTIRPGW